MATFEEAKQVKRKHSPRLLKTCGVDVQTDPAGQGLICLHLDTRNPASEKGIPTSLEGIPVKILHTGPFEKQT